MTENTKELGKGHIARSFLRSKDVGVLSTFKNQDGADYPYGSICPYVLTSTGEIIILVSNIALHTKNMKKTNRVSFTVFDMEAKNKQTSTRISVLADAEILSETSPSHAEYSDLYCRFFPESKKFFEVHDFDFYILKPKFVHFIQGFGKIYKFTGNELTCDCQISQQDFQYAINHMNEDHQSSIEKYLAKYLDVHTAKNCKILSMNSEGFHIESDDQFYYLDFEKKAETLQDLRQFLVQMAKA